MRKYLAAAAVLALAGLLFFSLGKESPPMGETRALRMLTAEQLLNKVHRRNEPLRVRSATDVLPGNYAAAMAPLVVEWQASQPEGPDGFVILHNLNHGGNPIEGSTVLCTARVPLQGVEAVEFTLLPLDKLAREGLIQHGQLRFIFAKDNPVRLLHFGDEEMGSDAFITDLVLSWEAWRPPDVGYDVMTGMNPSSYMLTPRLFSGSQRFLDDALGKRDWFSHRLRMPGGHGGLVELLKTSLALADGVARHSITQLLKQGEDDWLSHAPTPDQEGAAEAEEWSRLREAVAPSPIADVPLVNLQEKDQAYQSLLRSCATLALYTINVAVERLVADGHDDGLVLDNLMQPNLGEQEDWMTQLAGTDLRGVFLRAPAAVRYLRANPTAFPKKIPSYLENAGLLQMENGKPVKIHYSLEGKTPFGTLKENLIR